MDLSEEQWLEMLHQQAVKIRQESAEELDVLVNVWRHGDQVATAMCPTRESALACANILAFGMEAERIGLTFEGWFTKVLINPDTGEKWGPDEMGEFVKQHPESDVIRESIVTTVVNREGDVYALASEIITGDTGAVSSPSDFGDAPGPTEGYVPEQLVAAMNHGTITKDMGADAVARVEKDLGYDRRWFHQDMATLKALETQLGDELRPRGVMLLLVPGSEREKMFEERFEGDPSVISIPAE